MDFYDLIDVGLGVLDYVFVALFALAIFMVVWGIFKFIVHADDESERAKGRQAILWGVIGVFLMLSVWGLVNLFRNTLNLDDGVVPTIPRLPGVNN